MVLIKSLSKYDPDKILERITEIIVDYSKHKDQYDDDTIAELRANLSTGTYIFVETNLAPAYDDMVMATCDYERKDAECFARCFEEQKAKGNSPSLSSDLARKMYKMDLEYIEAFKTYTTTKNIIYISDKLLTQANQVLNSMGKRNR